MSNLREAATLALEALDWHSKHGANWASIDEATEALRAALATGGNLSPTEPVQEPAFHGFMSADGTQVDLCFTPSAPRIDGTYATAYYTATPQRKPLTDEEIDRITDQEWAANNHKPIYAAHRAYARAVERAHGIGEKR